MSRLLEWLVLPKGKGGWEVIVGKVEVERIVVGGDHLECLRQSYGNGYNMWGNLGYLHIHTIYYFIYAIHTVDCTHSTILSNGCVIIV